MMTCGGLLGDPVVGDVHPAARGRVGGDGGDHRVEVAGGFPGCRPLRSATRGVALPASAARAWPGGFRGWPAGTARASPRRSVRVRGCLGSPWRAGRRGARWPRAARTTSRSVRLTCRRFRGRVACRVWSFGRRTARPVRRSGWPRTACCTALRPRPWPCRAVGRPGPASGGCRRVRSRTLCCSPRRGCAGWDLLRGSRGDRTQRR